MQLKRAISAQASAFDRSRSIALWQSAIVSLSSSREASEPFTQISRARDKGSRIESAAVGLGGKGGTMGEEDAVLFHSRQNANNKNNARAVIGRAHFHALGGLHGLPATNEVAPD